MASTISTRSNVERKNGQPRYISRSMGSLPSSIACCSASPTPSQDGTISRICVQAKTQGIARSDSSPPDARRREGRLPMFRPSSSATGVAARK